MEYTRKIGGAPGAAGPPSGQERTMAFATVTCDSADPPNVAEMLLARGLAGIVRHRTDEERSAHYEALMEAEQVRLGMASMLVCFVLEQGSELAEPRVWRSGMGLESQGILRLRHYNDHNCL